MVGYVLGADLKCSERPSKETPRRSGAKAPGGGNFPRGLATPSQGSIEAANHNNAPRRVGL
jgi:hypothetical protein